VGDATFCDLDEFVKGMADETRQRILTLLQAGELNESEIVERMDHFSSPGRVTARTYRVDAPRWEVRFLPSQPGLRDQVLWRNPKPLHTPP